MVDLQHSLMVYILDVTFVCMLNNWIKLLGIT